MIIFDRSSSIQLRVTQPPSSSTSHCPHNHSIWGAFVLKDVFRPVLCIFASIWFKRLNLSLISDSEHDQNQHWGPLVTHGVSHTLFSSLCLFLPTLFTLYNTFCMTNIKTHYITHWHYRPLLMSSTDERTSIDSKVSLKRHTVQHVCPRKKEITHKNRPKIGHH